MVCEMDRPPRRGPLRGAASRVHRGTETDSQVCSRKTAVQGEIIPPLAADSCILLTSTPDDVIQPLHLGTGNFGPKDYTLELDAFAGPSPIWNNACQCSMAGGACSSEEHLEKMVWEADMKKRG